MMGQGGQPAPLFTPCLTPPVRQISEEHSPHQHTSKEESGCNSVQAFLLPHQIPLQGQEVRGLLWVKVPRQGAPAPPL
jgi:hypothetical protein